jgi:predicted RNA-binding protein
MSGRTRHLRDGELITNRKTDRRQSPPRPLLERLGDLNEKHRKRDPDRWVPDVRVGFLLPKSLEAFVASGKHGIGVNVTRGFVQITSESAEQCFQRAREFLAAVAKQRPAFTVMASVISDAHPERRHGRHMTVVNGALVISGGLVVPRVYEARAA